MTGDDITPAVGRRAFLKGYRFRPSRRRGRPGRALLRPGRPYRRCRAGPDRQPGKERWLRAAVPGARRHHGLELLLLPKGFEYMSFGWTNDPMTDGVPTPGAHDGMAAFRDGERVRLVRNHERGAGQPFGSADRTYDPASGGVGDRRQPGLGPGPAQRLNPGQCQGRSRVSRGEGAWYGNGVVYAVSTNGGPAGQGQVFAYDPAADMFTCVFASPASNVLKRPRQRLRQPRGGLVLCEDGSGLEYLHGLSSLESSAVSL